MCTVQSEKVYLHIPFYETTCPLRMVNFLLPLYIFQVFILMITGLFALPEVKLRQQIATEAHVELYCNTSLDGFLPPLVYNLSIIILCGCHGFLTRKLPENFNEAWYIFVSVATTSFLWLVFLPSYFTAFYAKYKVILLASCLLLNASITIGCLFLPKMYAVYFIDEGTLKYSISTGTETNHIAPSVASESGQET